MISASDILSCVIHLFLEEKLVQLQADTIYGGKTAILLKSISRKVCTIACQLFSYTSNNHLKRGLLFIYLPGRTLHWTLKNNKADTCSHIPCPHKRGEQI